MIYDDAAWLARPGLPGPARAGSDGLRMALREKERLAMNWPLILGIGLPLLAFIVVVVAAYLWRQAMNGSD